MKLISKRITQAEDRMRFLTKDRRVIIVWDTEDGYFEYEGKKYLGNEHLADNLRADYPSADIVIIAWV